MAKRKQSTFERLTRGRLNRKERKELVRRLRSDDPGLEVVHRNVSGIDIGNESHFVAVAPSCDPEPVREFGSWSSDVVRMADWLKSCGVEHVVMQSTGVYWIAVYNVLEEAGFQVCLANARDTKNLPGRKSDVQESQWLMKLHTYGLLRNSFRPTEAIRHVRTIWRLRKRNVERAAGEIQHMQKALTTMNVQLANTISDLSGTTGQTIVRAILKGERNPYKLAEMRDYRVRASQEEIARSLEGTWQEDVLFELQQAVDAYDFLQRQITKCDRELKKYMAALPDRSMVQEAGVPSAMGEPASEPEVTANASKPKSKNSEKDAGSSTSGVAGGSDSGREKSRKAGKKSAKNAPKFDLRSELTRICGVDMTTLDGVDVMTVQTFISELGTDMTRWPTEDNLVSWLKLAPNRGITGGKLIKHEHIKVKNRATEALRMAASSLEHSQSYLGAHYRHLKRRLEPKKAIKAMAAHLARLFYRMLTHGQAWVDHGAQAHERKRTDREMRSLQRKAAALGFRLQPAT
jgi:transposase